MSLLYQLYPQNDWTPQEKQMFDEIADEYRRSTTKQEWEHFRRWLRRNYRELEDYERIIWSYVLAL